MSSQKPIFIVDAMLGNLAKKLRLFGYDSEYFSDIEDEKLIKIAASQKRILLTKDVQLVNSAKKEGVDVIHIQGHEEVEQISQINDGVKLDKLQINTNNSRCSVCNHSIESIEKNRIIGKVPEGILERVNDFWICKGCKKIYWEGSHLEKLQKFVTQVNERLQ